MKRITLLFLLLIKYPAPAQIDEAFPIESLRAKYEDGVTAVDVEFKKKVVVFNQRYLKQLGEVVDHAKSHGHLDELIAVKAEMKRVEAHPDRVIEAINSSGCPELMSVHRTYLAGISRFLKARNKKISTGLFGYLGKLKALKGNYVSKEDVENALKVRAEEERVRDEFEQLKRGLSLTERPQGAPQWISKDATYVPSSFSRRGVPKPALLTGEGPLHGDQYAFSTAPQIDPYLVIDLGKQKLVQGLSIENRRKELQGRADTLTVWISSRPQFHDQHPVWQAEGAESEWSFKLPRTSRARYIKIGLRKKEFF
ncbi:MAG: hypothetical protein AAF492_12625, partial [Verrucomicrobiota bacterium]